MKIGIIGGTGIYDPELLENSKQIEIKTPYGKISDLITTGTFKGKEIAIIPRHGAKHIFNPSNVPYRANIYAFKKLGVTHILAPCAVGSLQDNIKPGDFVFVDQVIDRTYKRETTFHDANKVCHISMAEPFCSNLKNLLIETAKSLNLPYHEKGTYVCMEGPRFSTKAESKLYRSWNAHVIGMTLVPECVLARESEICYATIAMVTDYDSFANKPVSIEEVLSTMKNNIEKVKNLLATVIPKIPEKRTCSCKDALKNAFV